MTTTAREDARTIALVGLVHATSHFFHLLLPPLFPLFTQTFGLSYAQLGLVVTTFFVVSGVGQMASGFVVDRFGARPVLLTALACFVVAALAASQAQGLAGLQLAAALAGLGNAPFHPADFTILNRRIAPARLPHAFSVHGISGNLGWAAAPVLLLGLTTALGGNWRLAYLGAAALAAAVWLLAWWQRDALDDHHIAQRSAAKAQPQSVVHPFAFLALPGIWLCFSFFFFSTAALAAIQSFGAPALALLYDQPVARMALAVTGYLLGAAGGMVLGGFWAARSAHLERHIAIAMSAAAALLLGVATGWLGPLGALVALTLAGVGSGLAGPSRDLLIRRATPPGATGRVYGLVYSGLDAGFALATPLFGLLLDGGHPGAIFVGAALLLVLAIVAAQAVGLAGRRAAVA